MRFGSVVDDTGRADVVMRDHRYLRLETGERLPTTVRELAAAGPAALDRVRAWADAQEPAAWRPLDGAEIGPPVQPGDIYTIGENYRVRDEPPGERPARPLVFGKAASSVSGHGGTIQWDRALTGNVDAECELGVVIGTPGRRVDVSDAMRHVFGYTVINDVSSRDPWLDGDQWLLGKSMTGFCPVGPWIVTADVLRADALRLGCTINGAAIQDGTTAAMRFSIAEIVAYLSRHLTLAPGDLIATGTPARLVTPPGPNRHLEPGDVVTCWVDGIGELTTTIA